MYYIVGVNFNINDPSKRQASIFGMGGPQSAHGPILQNRRVVKGEVVDVNYRTIDKPSSQDTDAERARKAKVANHASRARFLASRPGATLDEDEFKSSRANEQASSSATQEWKKVADRKTPPQSVEERLSNLEKQVAELKDLLVGKDSNNPAMNQEIASDPDSRYMASSKQYSTFIPGSQSFTRKLADV